ncbi:MAG: pentapeptide repeat-containing protein [Leptolyngbyaceae cyanobacterium]
MNSDSEPRNRNVAPTNKVPNSQTSDSQGTAFSTETNGNPSVPSENANSIRQSVDAGSTHSLAADTDTSATAHNGQAALTKEEESALAQLPDAALPAQSGRTLPATAVILIALLIMILGASFNLSWLTLVGALVCLVLSWGMMWPSIQGVLAELSPQQQSLLVAFPAFIIGVFGLMRAIGINQAIQAWGRTVRWDVVGALGDFFGAFGQILVAMLALYVAWRQYIISRDLTVQQNRITQQQTIDAYFQGISDLVLDDEGLLEDWPQERIIAEARTAAILSSIDAPGKAKIIRFLSRSKLLTPLQRDSHLGRPIFDGSGGYAEDRQHGIRVIDLGAMLANADLSNVDLRWTDLSDVNLIRAQLTFCDLVRANFSRTILYQANLSEADLMGARLFYGALATASPRSRTEPPNYVTGEYTGAVIEGADFSGAKRLSEEQRRYCCYWGGEKTRASIPGGCEGLPNRLEGA